MVRGKPADTPMPPPQQPPEPEKSEVPASDRAVETTDNETKTKPKKKAKPWEDMSDETRQALMHQWKSKIVAQREKLAAAVAAKNSASGELRKTIQSAQGELGPDCMDYIKILEKLDTPEGEAEVRAQLKVIAVAFDWGNVKEGQQLTMFLDDDVVDIRPDTEVAFNEGKIACFQNKTRQPPAHYPPGSDRYGAWLEGFADGQEILMARFKEKKAEDDAPIGTEPATHTVVEDPPADRDLSGIAEMEAQAEEMPEASGDGLDIPPELDRRQKAEA